MMLPADSQCLGLRGNGSGHNQRLAPITEAALQRCTRERKSHVLG
jgi:hypothetical protein